MIDYHIPNDSLKHRRKIFKAMLCSDEYYIDGATDYCMLIPYSKAFNLNTEQKLWVAFIYGLSYSSTTAMRFQREFNTLKDVTPKKLQKFWDENKPTLWFNPDKKYIKNSNQAVPAIKCVYKLSHGCLEDYLLPLLQQGFDATYKEITTKWDFFGPMGAYLFFDVIYGLLPELYSDPENLDWSHIGKTVPEGMGILLGKDDEVADFKLYNKTVNSIRESFNKPKVIIESTLCAFRKLYKGTRYYGYYADRLLEECHSVADIMKNTYNIDLWLYRKKTIPEQLLGEVQGWTGIRTNRKTHYLSTGELL